MRVGQHLRPRAGIELTADVGKLLARVKSNESGDS